MKRLHFNTTIKRIKNLMLSDNFNKMNIIEAYKGGFVVVFPSGEKVTVNLGFSHLGDARPLELRYFNNDEKGFTSDNMKITWKFGFAVWNKLTLDNPTLNPNEAAVKRSLNSWARRVNTGYAKCLWDNKTILGA